jgi:hypothetical protein
MGCRTTDIGRDFRMEGDHLAVSIVQMDGPLEHLPVRSRGGRGFRCRVLNRRGDIREHGMKASPLPAIARQAAKVGIEIGLQV